ncbi:alcohol dehydrogenase-like regulatory protein ErcA [Desulforhopalus sp. IMCC35007]|uniref:alcohol dehydrogenase-like regulatory protein ErcA n=1 Tax=Desulforhopalus sp. IMCC35007 TaxID=2569543 RepID=UPI0010AE15D7|nr:alcohol dehydrogenase-like regulatory protein ErcA [Desulforhopalus sp. IMCC35007]TKB12336.1 iron-containing alcohol dehydrogenase [Desulforhopalus sp. IMCC35007]
MILPIRKFVSPEIIFGEGAIELLPQYVLNFNASRVFIVTDQGIIDAGWLNRVTSMFIDVGIVFSVFSSLHENPRDTEVMEGARQYKDSGCDVIVALGGGSPMDCAKAIGIVSTNRRHILEFEGVDNVDVPGPPLICIPTTAGSAADVSQFAIINNPAERIKIAVISKSMVPDVALIDPLTTITMGHHLTVSTGLDALVHAIEAYVSIASSALTDLHAFEAIRLIQKYLPLILDDLSNHFIREKIMLASLQAGLAFSNASLGAVHAMAHSLGGFYEFSHGECNGLLLEHVIAYNYDSAPKRYDRIGQVFGAAVQKGTAQEKCAATAKALRMFRESVGVSGTLAKQGVSHADIPVLAKKALADPCMLTNPKRPTLRDIEDIYEKAL